MIEVFEVIFAAGECVLFCLDVGLAVADGVAWVRGRENRGARREARRNGRPTVPLDFWNWAFWVMLCIVIMLSGFITYRLVTPN